MNISEDKDLTSKQLLKKNLAWFYNCFSRENENGGLEDGCFLLPTKRAGTDIFVGKFRYLLGRNGLV